VDINLEEIDERWLEGLKDHLRNSKQQRNKLEYLHQNSVHSYYHKVCATLNQAERERIIEHNPIRNVKRIPTLETWREYLTLDELKKVALVPCVVTVLKRAALFSALTGLRWSDIVKIQWKDIQHTKQDGYFLRFRQQKTKTTETKYLSQQAYDLLGETTDPESRQCF
jgi:integrase